VFTGEKTTVVIPDMRWGVDNRVANVYFKVDAAGNVITTDAGSSTGGGSTLTLLNTVMNFDVGNYTALYNGPMFDGLQMGDTSAVVIPDLLWSVDNLSQNLTFNGDSFGDVSTLSATSTSASDDTLAFKTVKVQIDPTSFDGNYLFSAQQVTSGVEVYDLTAGPYHFYAHDGTSFTLLGRFTADPIGVTPPSTEHDEAYGSSGVECLPLL
jgi:hypothetical protein